MVPTEYPRTKTGTPVSPSVTVNVNFRGYLQFLCIGLTCKFALQYATENLSDSQLVLVSKSTVDIQPYSTYTQPQCEQ